MRRRKGFTIVELVIVIFIAVSPAVKDVALCS